MGQVFYFFIKTPGSQVASPGKINRSAAALMATGGIATPTKKGHNETGNDSRKEEPSNGLVGDDPEDNEYYARRE
jgi:hypothetical protein